MSRRPAIGHPVVRRAAIRRPAIAALVLGLLLPPCLATCAGGSSGESGEGNAGEPSAASTGAPAGRDDPYAKLSLQDPQGRTIRLVDFKGQVRLIDVWATWCGPCRMIIPHLNRLSERYRGQGLVVIGVSVDEDPADVVEFTKNLPFKYPVGMMNREVIKLLGDPDAVPTSYLIDRGGHLRRKFVGFVDPETIEREVRKYLDKP